MPVCARLSRRFYDVVGEDVTQQLVDWRMFELRVDLRKEIAGFRTELLGGMFVFWITNFVG